MEALERGFRIQHCFVILPRHLASAVDKTIKEVYQDVIEQVRVELVPMNTGEDFFDRGLVFLGTVHPFFQKGSLMRYTVFQKSSLDLEKRITTIFKNHFFCGFSFFPMQDVELQRQVNSLPQDMGEFLPQKTNWMNKFWAKNFEEKESKMHENY